MDPVQIVVLHRGWVVVGKPSKKGAEIVLTAANIIRRWGTTKGLGEIAADGPTSKTILDLCGTVRVHELAVIMSIDCDADKWSKALA